MNGEGTDEGAAPRKPLFRKTPRVSLVHLTREYRGKSSHSSHETERLDVLLESPAALAFILATAQRSQ